MTGYIYFSSTSTLQHNWLYLFFFYNAHYNMTGYAHLYDVLRLCSTHSTVLGILGILGVWCRGPQVEVLLTRTSCEILVDTHYTMLRRLFATQSECALIAKV
jgi:hypothetical protein